MNRRSLLALLTALAVLPSAVFGSVAVVQDGCRALGGKNVEVLFSVVNFNLPAICDLHFIPENPVPGCIMISCSTPNGWQCQLRSDGGADYVAVPGVGCIEAGHVQHGFDFVLDPEFCCYIVIFTDANGQEIAQQEECFDCTTVAVEHRTWEMFKQLYR